MKYLLILCMLALNGFATDVPSVTLQDQSSVIKVMVTPLDDTQKPKDFKDWSTENVWNLEVYYKKLSDTELAFSIKNSSNYKKLIKIRCGSTNHPRQVATLVHIDSSDVIMGKFVFPKISDNVYDFDVVTMKDE